MFLLYFRLFTFSDLYWVCLSVFSCTVSVKWLAVKTASEMTYTVSSGALNSTPSIAQNYHHEHTNEPLVRVMVKSWRKFSRWSFRKAGLGGGAYALHANAMPCNRPIVHSVLRMRRALKIAFSMYVGRLLANDRYHHFQLVHRFRKSVQREKKEYDGGSDSESVQIRRERKNTGDLSQASVATSVQ